MAVAELPGEGLCLVDTNIWLYAFTRQDPEKALKAVKVLRQLVSEGRICLASQVAAEFTEIACRKFGSSAHEAERFVTALQGDSLVLGYGLNHVTQASRLAEQKRLSFWDALIWSVARSNGVRTIVSEDGPSGHRVEGVLYFNPFK